jgi:hypothetical protein
MVKMAEEKTGSTPKYIDVLMEQGKEARYWVKQNRLVIYDDGYPIYENDNGEICRDSDALADCYC